jgi:hypothetical protein
MATETDRSGNTGLLDLLCDLDLPGVEPVRHGTFLGLRGPHLSRVPQWLWDQLDRHEAALLPLLRNTKPPYRRRQGGGQLCDAFAG